MAINQPHTGKKFWIKSGKPSANALLSALLYKMGEKTPVVLEGWVSKQKMITGRESMMGTEVTIPEGFVPCDGIMDVEEAVCYPVFIEICRDELAYQYRQITDCSWMEAEDFVIKLKRKAEKEFEAESREDQLE